MIAQSHSYTTGSVAHTGHRHLERGLARDSVAMRIAALRLITWRQRKRQTTTEFHADHELTVDVQVEAELAAVANREVGHDLRIAPDRRSGFEGELLVDREVVDERTRRLESTKSTRRRPGRVDHHVGAELVVLTQVTVDVVHEHQHDDRAAGEVTAHAQPAV